MPVIHREHSAAALRRSRELSTELWYAVETILIYEPGSVRVTYSSDTSQTMMETDGWFGTGQESGIERGLVRTTRMVQCDHVRLHCVYWT